MTTSPKTHPSVWKEVGAVASCLFGLYALSVFGLLNFDKWSVRAVDTKTIGLLLGILFGTYVSLIFSPPRFRKRIHLASAALSGVSFCGFYAGYIVLLSSLFFGLVLLRWKMRFKILAVVVVFELLAYLLLDVFLGQPSGDGFFYFGFLFCLIFMYRYALFFFHMEQSKSKIPSFSDFLLYMFLTPFWILVPHIAVMPGYRYFMESDRPGDPAVRWSGLRLILWGATLVLLAKLSGFVWELTQIPDVPAFPLWIRSWGQTFNAILISDLLSRPLYVLLYLSGHAHILVGMIRLLGFDLKPVFDRPFLSRDIFEFYNRIMIYYREFLVTVFYFPLQLAFRKLAPWQNRAVALVFTLTAGYALTSFLGLGLDLCDMVYAPEYAAANSPLIYTKGILSAMPEHGSAWVWLHTSLASFSLSVLIVALFAAGLMHLIGSIKKGWDFFGARGLKISLAFLTYSFVIAFLLDP